MARMERCRGCGNELSRAEHATGYACFRCRGRATDLANGAPIRHEHVAGGSLDARGYARCRGCGERFRVLVARGMAGPTVIELGVPAEVVYG